MARQSVVAATVFSGLAALVLAQSTVAPPQESVAARVPGSPTAPGRRPLHWTGQFFLIHQ